MVKSELRKLNKQLIIDNNKYCNLCNLVKPIIDFNKDKRWCGKETSCKVCRNKQRKNEK